MNKDKRSTTFVTYHLSERESTSNGPINEGIPPKGPFLNVPVSRPDRNSEVGTTGRDRNERSEGRRKGVTEFSYPSHVGTGGRWDGCRRTDMGTPAPPLEVGSWDPGQDTGSSLSEVHPRRPRGPCDIPEPTLTSLLSYLLTLRTGRTEVKGNVSLVDTSSEESDLRSPVGTSTLPPRSDVHSLRPFPTSGVGESDMGFG